MRKESGTLRRVAVVIEASNAYARGLLAGIHAHIREHEPWTVFLPEHGHGKPPLESLRHGIEITVTGDDPSRDFVLSSKGDRQSTSR